MYKKLIAISLLTTALMTSAGMLSNVVAQEKPAPSGKEFIMPIGVQCDTVEAMTAVINGKYGEFPFTKGDGTMTVMSPQGPTVLPGVVKLWANPETWSFSITIEDPNPQNDVMCMLTSGKNLAPNKSKGNSL